jgi:hypothetical protein
MANHKFNVGQMVDLIPSRAVIPALVRAYKILRVLPQEGGEPLYRIKNNCRGVRADREGK